MSKVKQFIMSKFKEIFSRKNTEEINKSNIKNPKWILDCQENKEFKVIELEWIQTGSSYNSTWMIYFIDNGRLSNLTIVTSSSSNRFLFKKLFNVQSIADILALDEKDTIYSN